MLTFLPHMSIFNPTTITVSYPCTGLKEEFYMTANQTINQSIINEFSKTVEMFGVSPNEARIYTVVYLNEEPMTLDEMSYAVGKSKTSVNTGIRNLSELSLVKQVWKKGIRKDLYITDQDLYQRFMHCYVNKWINQTSIQKQMLENIKAELAKNSSKEKNDKLDKKLTEMITFHKLIEEAFLQLKPLK